MSSTGTHVSHSGAPHPSRGPRRKHAPSGASTVTSSMRTLHYLLPSPASVGVTPVAVDASAGATRNLVPFPSSPAIETAPLPLREVDPNVHVPNGPSADKTPVQNALGDPVRDWPVQIMHPRAQSCLTRSYVHAHHMEPKPSPPAPSQCDFFQNLLEGPPQTPPAAVPPHTAAPPTRQRVPKRPSKPHALLVSPGPAPMRAAPARPPRNLTRRPPPLKPTTKRPMMQPSAASSVQKPPPAAARRRAREDLNFVALIRRSVLWNMQERLRLLEARARVGMASSASSSQVSLAPPLSPSTSTSSESSTGSLSSSCEESSRDRKNNGPDSRAATQAFAADVALVAQLSARLATHAYAPSPADRLLLRSVHALLDPAPVRTRHGDDSESDDDADDECDTRRRGSGPRPPGTYALCQVVASMTLRRRDRMAIKARVPTMGGEARVKKASRLCEVANAVLVEE